MRSDLSETETMGRESRLAARCPGGAEYGHGMSLTTVHAGDCCKKFSEGDLAEVLPSESRAGSQAGLNGPSGSPTSPSGAPYELRVHVPISQVWPKSRGGQSGKTHLHVNEWTVIGRIRRAKGRSLCGRSGWYEREPDSDHERGDICPRCAEIAARVA